MLPSRGLFKEEPCPLYEIGECNRPHCHYRHKKADASGDFFDYFASLEEALDKIPINWGPSKQSSDNSNEGYNESCDKIVKISAKSENLSVSVENYIGSSDDVFEQVKSKVKIIESSACDIKESVVIENKTSQSGKMHFKRQIRFENDCSQNGSNVENNDKINDSKLLELPTSNTAIQTNASSSDQFKDSKLLGSSSTNTEINSDAKTKDTTSKDDDCNPLAAISAQYVSVGTSETIDVNIIKHETEESVEQELPSISVPVKETYSENKLTKEHLRGIDEIVKLLKKVPERIDFVASFLKSFVHTEEKSRSSASTSSASSHKKSHSHSSRSHKSSRSSRDSERRHKTDRHRKSSRNDRKEHSKSSNHSSEKRKRESDTHNGNVVPRKISRRESTAEKPLRQGLESSPEEDLDSEECPEAVPELDDSVDPKEEDEEFTKRLSIEEELERLHDFQIDVERPLPSSFPHVSNSGKRRVAHDTPYISDHKMLRAKVGKSAPITRPIERISSTPTFEAPADTSRPASLFSVGSVRTRIVAVPNAQRMLAEKSNITSSVGRSNFATPTIAKSVAPGVKRMEHKSENPDVLCPLVTVGSRTIPSSVRNLTLKRLYTAMQYYPSKNEAKDEALLVEGKIFEEHKDSSKKYHMASVNAIMKAKRGFIRDKPSGPTELEFYERVKNFILTQEELVKNGFPIEIEEGYARCLLSEDFKYNRKYRYIKDAFARGERFCIRCSMTYKVNEETWEQTPVPDVCVFHSDSGKRRVLGEVTHKCCSTPGKGCMSESLHITDLKDYDRLPNCVKSRHKFPEEKYRRVLALDCEMVHTRLGVELAYIVVVDSSCSVVYESLCKPSHEVECYNTAYSGMTEEKLRNVTKTLSTIQKELLELISDETVLVGHSLDSDMRALHIIHETVADTAFLYRVESPDGSFYKRRLKELAQTYLGKIIQESEYGHSAEEDAAAAMALLRHRILSM